MAVLATASITSCGNSETHTRPDETRLLYEESVRTAKVYIDSLRHAKDSASVARLNEHFEATLTRLNYKYAPDIDPMVSEGENDTLTQLNMRFALLRDSLLLRYRERVPTDTLSQDSI